MDFFATCVYLWGNLRVRFATQPRKFNLPLLATTCKSVWPGLNKLKKDPFIHVVLTRLFITRLPFCLTSFTVFTTSREGWVGARSSSHTCTSSTGLITRTWVVPGRPVTRQDRTKCKRWRKCPDIQLLVSMYEISEPSHWTHWWILDPPQTSQTLLRKLWRKRTVMFLPHFFVLQFSVSIAGPSFCLTQVFPLFFGLGLVQVLECRRVPPPQVAVHSVHLDHSV